MHLWLCFTGAQCNLVHPGYTVNVAPEPSIGSAERKLLSSNFQQVRNEDLEIGTFVEDGVDLKKSKNLGLEKERCQLHMARCQQKRVHTINLSAETVGKTIKQTKVPT